VAQPDLRLHRANRYPLHGHAGDGGADRDNRLILSESASTTENSITTTATFSLSLLDKAVERARTNTPAIRPLQIGGKPMYAVFMHPYQVTDLRTSTSTGQWLDIQKAAMTGGEIQDNPIFDGLR
jgi:N4-gp56 family major capsid protein